jgi:hypothetical protein
MPNDPKGPPPGGLTPRRGGRARVGTVLKTRDGRLQGQVTFADGSRKRLKPFPKGTSEAMAREKTAYHAEIAAKITPKKAAPEKTPEIPDTPMGRWFKAWLADREAKGYSSGGDNTAHYLLHITPSLGPKHVRDWSRDDLRKLSLALDGKVAGGEAGLEDGGERLGHRNEDVRRRRRVQARHAALPSRQPRDRRSRARPRR